MIKSFSHILFPVPLSLLVLSVGVAYSWEGLKIKIARRWISLGWALLLLLSSRSFGGRLLEALENRYPALIVDDAFVKGHPARVIVVLGGLTSRRTDIPLSSRLNAAMMARLIEGIRLHREIPGSQILLSGGGGSTPAESDAVVMRQMALALGVSDLDLILESESTNTHEEAILIRKMLGDRPLILVTSAAHMPRAMGLFSAQGMHPIAAPTNFLVDRTSKLDLDWIIPSLEGFQLSTAAAYEYLGLAKDRFLARNF